ncbi:hypothetical protein OIU77_021957 [Salix suchowensis]|uniref:Bulb-type lectin domain-containing protein n=1 Tax=Salix suchowensis TaxID=1278906 RepID=A0ABQ9CBM6_9ROSI|nr:hypothetical protein OIU77_021957 [Salix suchowensis]
MIAPNQSIEDGDALVSSGQSYTLGFFGSDIDSSRRMWEFGTIRLRNELLYGWQIEIIRSMVPPGVLAINKQGSLVIYINNRNSVPAWSTTVSASSMTNSWIQETWSWFNRIEKGSTDVAEF